MYVWLNGSVVREEDVKLSPFDHGLLTGDGVFETLRVYNGIPFAWTRHLLRLGKSARALGLKVPGMLHEAAQAVTDANRLTDARLRITLTGGVSPLGSSRGDNGHTVLLQATELAPRETSVAVGICPWLRYPGDPLAGLKTTSYAGNVRALAWAHEHGYDEAIFGTPDGLLSEGSGTNVFVVRDGVARTPPLTTACLAGVTRALVLELGAQEADLTIEDLRAADEAFLTSSTREVQPIHAIDGRPLATGEVTRTLAKAYGDLVVSNPDP